MHLLSADNNAQSNPPKTGKTPVHHGIVSDHFYDQSLQKYFYGGARKSDFALDWWKKAEPLWVTAQNERISVAMYYWTGCNVEFSQPPTLCIPRRRGATGQPSLTLGNVKAVIEATKESDLVIAYHNKIGLAGQDLGPNHLKASRGDSIVEVRIWESQNSHRQRAKFGTEDRSTSNYGNN